MRIASRLAFLAWLPAALLVGLAVAGCGSDEPPAVVELTEPEAHEVMSKETAYLITNMMEDVIRKGTGQAARVIDRPIAGKTGTTNDFINAWFIGGTPNLVTGVFVGFDDRRSLGETESGAHAALPIWIDFMRAYIDTRADRKAPPMFEAPGNIVFVALDSGVTEAFINGTQPQAAAPAEPAVTPASTPAPTPASTPAAE